MLDEKDIKILTEVFGSKKHVDEKMDDFALMVQKGFNDVTEKMATKTDLNELKKEMEDMRKEMHAGFKETAKLEPRIKRLEDALAID